ISEKATHWVAFLRLGETNLLLMLALKPLEVLTSQLPNFPTSQLPNFPTSQLLSSFNDSLDLFDFIPLRRAISHEYNYRK
ncbi:hypothetical protein, partial [Providencia sp. PROV113]|uniref:hypothetical protein n=1 Tax=Providencia sp. PROV113 TaxID=2949824 RepID=UPI002349C95D